MKNRTPPFIPAGLCLLISLLANHAGAALVTTWDPQGTVTQSPFYTNDLSGTWESAAWSTATAETGIAPPVQWVEGTAALFAVNSGTGTPAFTVTMNANHTVAGIFDGPDNPNPCPVTITGTGTLTLLAANANHFYITGNSLANVGSLTVNNVITGAANAPLYLEGHGYANIYLNGVNTYSGATVLGYSAAALTISANFNNNSSFGTGSIVISNTAAVNCGFVAEGTSAITLANPVVWAANTYNNGMNIVGVPAANGGLTFSGPWTLTSTARIGSSGSGNLVNISGVMSGAGGLNYSVSSTPGLLELTATNTYTGTTTITNGVLQLGDGVAKSGNIAGNIVVNGTATTVPASLVWANPTAITYSKVISGTGPGPITYQGLGVLTLSGANTYSNATSITAGTVKLGVANALPGGTGKGDVSLASGATLDMGGFSGAINGLNGAGTVDNSTGTGTYTLTVGDNDAYSSFSGIIQNTSGTVALTQNGAAVLSLGGVNTYAGATIINTGTVQVAVANAIPAASSVVVNDNYSVLDLNSLNDTIAALSVGGLPSGPGSVNNLYGTLTVSGNAATVITQNFNGFSCIGGMLNGSGTLVKGGTHAMAFRGNNSGFSGTITLAGGTLSVGAAPNLLPTSLALNVPAGALFQLDANNQTLAGLTGSGSVNLGGGALTVAPGGTATFSGVIQNSKLAGSSTALGNGLRGYYYTNIDMTGLNAVTDNAQVNYIRTPPNSYTLACNGTSTGYGALVTPSGSLTGTYTVECWAYPSNTTANISMIGTRRPTDFGFDMKFDAGGNLIHGDIGNGTAWATTTADAPFAFAANTWYHIAYVVTPTGYTIYANGNQIGTGTYTATTPVLYDANHLLYIGQYGNGEYFNGQLSEIRIWNTARTATQIQTNMNQRLVGTEAGLVGYWRCDDGSGTTLTATVGANGTLAASTGWAASTAVVGPACHSARWLGQVLTTANGNYTFTTTTGDGARLWVNGIQVIDSWVDQSATARSGTIALAANTRYDIVMESFNDADGGSAALLWTPPGDATTNFIPASHLFLPGAGSLVMGGTGTEQLTGTSTYSGGTIVSSGTLDANVGGALGSGNVTVAAGATLQSDSSSAIGPAADVIVTAGSSSVNLHYTGTNIIHAISLDGGSSYAATGTYGAGAINPSGTFIGAGYVTVTASPTANVLTSSPGSPATVAYGTPVSLTSTVTGSAPTPSGTVTFYDGANWLGSVALNVSGVATLSVSNLLVDPSPHSLIAVYSGDSTHAASTSGAVSVTTQQAAITPIPVVASKTYDGTTTATITSVTFGGILPSDTNYVHIDLIPGDYAANFVDPNVGVGKTVNISGLNLIGSLADNYTLSTTSVSTTANITNKVLTISGLTANNRPYDADTNETVTGTAALNSGVVAGDTITLLTATPVYAFTDKTVGTGKPVVIVSGYSLTGSDPSNYILVLTNLKANITTFPVAVTGVTATNKVYDGSTLAGLTGTPVLTPTAFAGDDVHISATNEVANFATAGTNTPNAVTVTGYALYGNDATNYALSQPSGLTATISQALTTATITSSPNPASVGSPVTFTFTVTSTTPTLLPPTGSVTFYTNLASIGGYAAALPASTLVRNTPMSSIATFTTSVLGAGTYKAEALYNGDANFKKSNTPTLNNQVVQSTVCSQMNKILSVTANGGNSYTLNLLGTQNAQYYILWQTDVSQPIAKWMIYPGSTNTVANANGQWSFTVMTNPPAFFRVEAVSACP